MSLHLKAIAFIGPDLFHGFKFLSFGSMSLPMDLDVFLKPKKGCNEFSPSKGMSETCWSRCSEAQLVQASAPGSSPVRARLPLGMGVVWLGECLGGSRMVGNVVAKG